MANWRTSCGASSKRVSDKSAFLETYLNSDDVKAGKKDAPAPCTREVLLILDLYANCMRDDVDGASDLRKKNY